MRQAGWSTNRSAGVGNRSAGAEKRGTFVDVLLAFAGVFLLLCAAVSATAQTPDFAASQQQQPPPVPLLSPDQLDNLVAPIALYPDQLLGQVFAASTYPLEVVEAQQWLQQNRALQGPQLLDAAKQHNWDPSVQAMVAFPEVLTLLNQDIRWTTDLGNAFLAQQADVMNAVQRMRARAQQNGRLASTPQQMVTTEAQNGQSAIDIQPANPQVMYVPNYSPNYVWGPPVGGGYPPVGYPNSGSGFSFNPGVLISALFTGLTAFSGWGWGLSWLTHGLLLSNFFFSHFFGGLASLFGGGGGGAGLGGGYGDRVAWVHNPGHRLGVPYPNRVVASRFSGFRSDIGRSGGEFSGARSYESRAVNGGWNRFNGNASNGAGSYRLESRGTGSYRENFAAGRSTGYREPAGSQGFGSSGERGYQGGSGYGQNYSQGYGRSPVSSGPLASNRGFEANNRGFEANRGVESAGRYNSPGLGFRSPGSERGSAQTYASNFRGASPGSGYSAPHYSAPKMASNRSEQHFSQGGGRSPHVSAPHGSSHSGGHSSGHSGGHSGKHK